MVGWTACVCVLLAILSRVQTAEEGTYSENALYGSEGWLAGGRAVVIGEQGELTVCGVGRSTLLKVFVPHK